MEIRTTDTTGTGEVHARVSSEPDKGQGVTGKFNPGEGTQGGQGGGMQQKAGEMANQAQQKASEMAGQAQQKAGQMADQAQQKAGDMASQAKNRASQMMDQAESTLEQKTGAISKAQENPLAALGLAFAVGFLLAGSGDDGEQKEASRKEGKQKRGKQKRKGGGGLMGSAMNQITGAVMGGLSAAVSRELKDYVDQQGGVGNLVSQFTGMGGGHSGAGTTQAGTTQR